MVPTEQTNSIKSKITELKTQYKESLDKAQRVISDLEHEKEKFIIENKRLESDNTTIARKKEKLEQEFLENQKLLGLATSQNKDLQTKLKNFENLSQKNKNELEAALKELETNKQQNKININKVTIIANKRKELVESYKQKSEDSEKEVKTLAKDLTEQIKNRKHFEEKSHTLEKNFEALNSENQKNKTQLEDLKASLKNMLAQKENLQNQLKSIEQDNALLKKQAEESKEEKVKFEKQINEFKDKITGLQHEIDKIIKSETTLTSKNKQLEAELKAITSAKDALEKKATEFENELREVKESYELKLDIKERKVKELSKNIEEELKHNAKISSEKESLKDEITRLNNERRKNEQEYQSVREKYNNQEKEKEELMAEHNQMLTELDQQIAILTKGLNETKTEKENLENTLKSFHKELAEVNKIKSDFAEKQEVIQELKLDLSDKTSKLNHSAQEIKDLQEQLEKINHSKKREIDRFDKEINSLITENSSLKVNNSKKEIELEVARQDIHSLKRIIENLKNGTGSPEDEIYKKEIFHKETNSPLTTIEDFESEIEHLQSRLERTKKTKDNEIQHLYKEIEKLNKKQLRSSHISDSEDDEKDSLIESLEEKNDDLLDEIAGLTQAKKDEAEKAQQVIKKLNEQIARLNSNKNQPENQDVPEEISQDEFDDEVHEGIANLLKKEDMEINDLKDKVNNLEINKKDLTSIEELYKTTLQHKQILEKIVEEKISQVEESQAEKTPDEEEFVKKLELYKDLISEEKAGTGKVPDNGNAPAHDIFKENKVPVSSEIIRNNVIKRPLIVNLEQESTSRSINEQLDKVERSLSHLQNKKTKAQKLDNTIYIFGGNKELEDNWKLDLEKCLQEYGLTHQWLLGSDKEMIKGPGKGIIFLISVSSLQYLENSELILRNTNIPAIKHPLTNITKLKLDIIDNFVRKR
jgi:chromosome segregation ATPase